MDPRADQAAARRAVEHQSRQRAFDLARDDAAQLARAVVGREAAFDDPLRDGGREGDLQAAAAGARGELAQLTLRDADRGARIELLEHDGLVDAAQEFRAEALLQRLGRDVLE